MRAPGGWPVHLVLAALLLPRAILLGEALFDRDLHMDWYPRALVFAQTIRRGFLPLWDLTIGFGQPLLADPSAQVLYPTTWLNLLLAPWTVYNVFALGHLVFTAVGFTLLARSVGLRQGEAVVAGAAWMLCGPVASLVNLWHHFASAAWMPWVVLAAHRLARRPSPARIAAFALCLGFQVLAGSGDMVLLTAALVGAWWLAAGPPWRRSPRAVAPVVAGILLAAALSAGQWLPTVELAADSARRALPGNSRTQWSVPPAGLVRFAVPLDASGRIAYTPAAHAALFDGYRHPFFASLYVGVVALALGSLGLVQRRSRRLALVLATVAALALLVSMGGHTPVYGLAVRLVPLAEHFRFPTKVTVLVGFAMAMLAGLGLGALRHRPRGRVFAASLALFSAVLLTVGATFLGPGLSVATDRGLLLDRPGAAGDALPSLVRLLGHALLAGAAALTLLRARRGVAWPRALVGACLVADLLLAHHDLHSTVPAEFFQVPPPVLSALDLAGRARTYVYEYEILSGTSQRLLGRQGPYSVAQPAPGIDPRPLAAFGMRVYPVPPCAGYWGVEGSWDLDKRGLQPLPLVTLNLLLRDVETTPAHSRLLRLGAVRNVVSLHERGFGDLVPGPTFTSLFGEPIRTFRVPGTLPRVYAVSRARIVPGESVTTVLLDPSFEAAREVVLPGFPTRVEGEGPGDAVGPVEIQELFADRVRVVAELTRPGYVVSVDAWDRGWRGTVDGRPTAVLPANGVFRAVAVPAGRHTVEMVYRPPSVLWGLATSIAAGLVLAALGVPALRRRRPVAP
ncbi:MAG: YfhO family protein [Acidobacteria bacterium]|nr:YfhO family protein [Acidobacteriota bacterium]